MRIFQVDAFTSTRFTGNPAIVVLDADGQSDATLAAIAREFAHAEVAFVLAADAADHDCRLRFFNVRKEAPFVGHATVAAHAVLLSLQQRGVGTIRQKSGTGIIDVYASDMAEENAAALIAFRQNAPTLNEPLPLKEALRVAQALQLPGELLHEQLPARVARKGSTRLLLPVADASALTLIDPDHEQLQALGREFGAEGFFVFAHDRNGGRDRTHARMFCPALGIPEDPVSGNAHAMLAAYLWDAKRLNPASPAFIGHQGSHVGRPGIVKVTLEIDAQTMLAARIGGHAVIVSAGTLVR